MADRFPLIVNSTDQQIQELVSGDNLDLTGSSIISATSIGIGLASPTQSLHVQSGSNTTARVSAHGYICRDNYGTASSLGNGMMSPATNSLAFATNSVERMRIDASGNMGLGTNNPVQQSGIGLHIHNASGQSRLKLSNGTTGATANDGFDFIVESSNDVHILNHENGVFKFGTNDQEAMRINSARQLLLGTGTEGHESADDFTIAAGSHAGMTIRSGNTSQGSIYFSDATSGAGEYAGWLRYDHSANNMTIGTNSTEAIKIDNQQNFGIGGIAPSAKLHVKLDTNKHLYFQGNIGEIGSVPGIQGVTDAGSLASLGLRGSTLRFATGSAERMRIDSSGRVGVGTASPSTLLHLIGSADTYLTLEAGTTDGNDGILFKNSAGTQKGALLYDTDDNYLLFNVNESERMRINNSGNVGINRIDPDQRLNVSGNIETNAYDGTSGSGGYYTSKGLIIGNAYDAGKSVGDDRNGIIWQERGLDLVFATTDTERLRIDSAGNMGLGTTSPQKKLHISDTTGPAQIRITGSSGSSDIYADANIYFQPNGTTRVTMDSSGRLLVGTTTPGDAAADNLTIHSSGDTGITIRASETDSSSIYFADGTGGTNVYTGAIIYDHATNHMSLHTNSGAERLRIDSSGRLFINHTANTAGGGYDSKLQLCDTSYQGASISIRRDGNSTGGGAVVFSKSRSTSKGGSTAVLDGDNLGNITFYGADGTDTNTSAATIRAEVDGTPGSNDMPGRIVFGTTSDGASSTTERMRITSSGNVSLGNQTVNLPSGKGLQIYDSTTPRLKLANSTTGTASGDGSLLYVSGSDFIIENKESANMRFYTSATERLRIDSDGTLRHTPGGGTSSTYLLGKVENTTDYVFRAQKDGVYSTAIVFATQVSGSATECLRIDTSGNINVGSSTVSGTGVHLRPFGNIISRRASGALQVFEGYQGSTLTSEIKADGSATFAGGYGSSGVSITSDGEVRADSQVTSNRSSGVCFSAQQGGTQKASISADGSASFAARLSPGTTSLNDHAIVATNNNASNGVIVAQNMNSSGSLFQGYDSSSVKNVEIKGDGSANFTQTTLQKPGSTDSTQKLLVCKNASGGTQVVQLFGNGNATFNGAVSKGSGSFRIDHPLKPETHQLVHSFVEGPQADNIYRGKVELVDGAATVNIDTVAGMTEGTFAALNREIQCFTTNETGWTAIKGSVTGNLLTIVAQDDTCTDTISWLVIGERKDKHMYDTEWTDENGKVIVEPEKEVGTESETE